MRIVLVDTCQLFRTGLRCLLERRPDHDVVGDTASGRKALTLVRERQPDTVVVDVTLKDLNGIELTRQIRAQAPGCRVLMLSDRADPDAVTEALRVGAAGYALKTISPTELLRALATVADGKVYLSPEIAGVVVDQHLRGGRAAEETGPLLDLTPREREVLQLLAEGHTTKEIASRLFISPKTVGSHRQHIMNKLDLHTVADLTRCAIRLGLASVRR